MSQPEHIAKIIPKVTKKLKLQAWVASEEQEQEHIFAWAKMMEGREPRLTLLNASMNGILTDGAFGAKLKRLGRKRGYPDLFLPVQGYAGTPGLFIELKRVEGGKVSPEQEWFHAALREQGYQVEVARGAKAAIAIIEAYLHGE